MDTLLGDPTKAKERLGWTHKTTFDELVNEMVDADLRQLKNERRFNRDDGMPQLRIVRYRLHPGA